MLPWEFSKSQLWFFAFAGSTFFCKEPSTSLLEKDEASISMRNGLQTMNEGNREDIPPPKELVGAGDHFNDVPRYERARAAQVHGP